MCLLIPQIYGIRGTRQRSYNIAHNPYATLRNVGNLVT